MADAVTGGSTAPTMRAAVFHGPHDVRVEERPVPRPGPGEVLLEVSHCGVCGTDLHFVLQGWGTDWGRVAGHEYSGTVTAVGDGVEGWAPGDAVIVGAGSTCGTCRHCRAGRPSLCTTPAYERSPDGRQGAFAEYTVAHVSELRRVPPGLSLRDAALAEPLAVALHGIARGGAEPGTRVLVTGCGPIGALTVAALRAGGVEGVVVSEPAPARAALAEALGARVVPADGFGRPRGQLVAEPFDVAIECSGHARAAEDALYQLDRGGVLVLSGAGIDDLRLPHARILSFELTVTGAYCYGPGGFEESLALLASGRLPLDVLTEPVDVGLDGLYDAITSLGGGELASKVLVDPRA